MTFVSACCQQRRFAGIKSANPRDEFSVLGDASTSRASNFPSLNATLNGAAQATGARKLRCVI